MKCYACENDAAYECRRCGKLYCGEHGDELCADCLRPAGALPSYLLYRGSLLALLAGTAIALFLLLKPPEEASESVPSILAPTSTPFFQPPIATSVFGTPATTLTPAPSPSPTPAAPARIEHVVSEGDSLFSIAEQYVPPGEALDEFARRIAEANGISMDDPMLQPGQTLIIPR